MAPVARMGDSIHTNVLQKTVIKVLGVDSHDHMR